MLKRIKQNKRLGDVNQLAHYLVDASTRKNGDSIPPPTKAQISQLMAAMGRKGGKIGGKRRLETMSAKARRQVAQKAAKARWGKEG